MSKEAQLTITRTQLTGAVEESTQDPVRLVGDSDSGSLRVALMVWDTDLLQYVRLPLSAFDQGDLESTMSDIEAALVSNYWHDLRLDYTSGDLDYRGVNSTHKASTAASTWYIWKYTWSSGNLVRSEGPLVGAWDNRASLSWA